jgi:hypothetical protein
MYYNKIADRSGARIMQTLPVVCVYVVLLGVWSSTWIVIKAGLHGAPPLIGAGTRFLTAGLVLAAFQIVTRRPLRVERIRPSSPRRSLFGIGECFHSTALAPLVAELAPAGLRGRYMAAIGLSWSAGLALAPTLGTQLLTVSPAAALVRAAAVAAAAGAAALTLEPALPEASRLTPRPR